MKRNYLNLVDQRHISLFCNVLNISSGEISDIYVNPGRSANNSNFVFVVDNETFLYRIPGKGTEKFCSRSREAFAYKALSPFEITDKVIYLSKKTGIKISKYYKDSRIPFHANNDELIASMASLRKLHGLKIGFPFTDTLFDRLERYRTFVYEVGGEKYYLEGFEHYINNIRSFREYLYSTDIEFCFTHGDASINNILITKEYNYPILIDMEFPAMSDPFEDIATFCVDAEYREKDILLMLEYYLGRKGTLKEQFHVLGLSVAAALMWYSWAAYKCAVEENNQQFIDFRDDYHQYMQEVYHSAMKVYRTQSLHPFVSYMR